MKPVHYRLAAGVIGLAYIHILLILQKIIGVPILAKHNLILLIITGAPLSLFISKKISKGYSDAEETNDLLFGLLLVVLGGILIWALIF
jgi:hypothetical protein